MVHVTQLLLSHEGRGIKAMGKRGLNLTAQNGKCWKYIMRLRDSELPLGCPQVWQFLADSFSCCVRTFWSEGGPQEGVSHYGFLQGEARGSKAQGLPRLKQVFTARRGNLMTPCLSLSQNTGKKEAGKQSSGRASMYEVLGSILSATINK